MLRTLLEEYCEGVRVVAEAADVDEAANALTAHHPDVAFLDVELRGPTGLDLLPALAAARVRVVFVTAYAEYAIEALRGRAVDYLVKPIDVDELRAAVGRVRGAGERPLPEPRLAVAHGEGRRLLAHRDIVHVEADGSYSTLTLVSGERLLVVRKLGELERDLAGGAFFRVHRSHLVALGHVRLVRNGAVELTDGVRAPVSRNRAAALREALGLR